MKRSMWLRSCVVAAVAFAGLTQISYAQEGGKGGKPGMAPAAKPAQETKKDEPKKEEPKKADEKKEKDIVDTAMGTGKHNTLCSLLKAAGLVDTLKGKGPFTVFAPTDEAFAKLPKGTVEEWMKPENKDALKGVLTYHVLGSKVMAADAKKMDGKMAKTVNGAEAKIAVKDGKVMFDAATVTMADVACTNGVIHVVDAVAMPPAHEKSAGDKDKKEEKKEEKKAGH
ncbi:MAG: fasciclin domain-containing protein [Phycisphaerae bacterium]